MSIYIIETHIAYCDELDRTKVLFDNNYQSSSSSLLFEFGINLRSNAASTFIEQCGHVKLFSNHLSIHDGWNTCAPSHGNCRTCSLGIKSSKQISHLEK